MSNDIYIKPLARKDENGNTIYFSAYTNRKIKIYPGETPQQRELRLRRNFETTKKTRKMQESMLRECKEEKNRLSEENRELLVMKQKLSVRILEEDLYYSKREQVSLDIYFLVNENHFFYWKIDKIDNEMI